MSKYEVDVEIKGLKVRIRGEREQDLPDIRSEVQKHIAGALQATPTLFDSLQTKRIDSTSRPVEPGDAGQARSKTTRRRRAPGGESRASSDPIIWQHDQAKWGMPKSSWTIGNKILWLLYVVKNETQRSQMSASDMVRTWNDKFKQFGLLRQSSMTTATNGLKTIKPALAMDDTTKSPIEWFITDDGGKAAERLVQEAKSPTPQAV